MRRRMSQRAVLLQVESARAAKGGGGGGSFARLSSGLEEAFLLFARRQRRLSGNGKLRSACAFLAQVAVVTAVSERRLETLFPFLFSLFRFSLFSFFLSFFLYIYINRLYIFIIIVYIIIFFLSNAIAVPSTMLPSESTCD